MKAILTRTKGNALQTNGVMGLFNNDGLCVFSCVTLERGDLGNEKMKSSIPTGTYDVKRRFSPKFGNHFEVVGVPDRSLILFHPANFWKQLNGCISVGQYLQDIDKDGLVDCVNSKSTFEILKGLAPDGFSLQISNVFKI